MPAIDRPPMSPQTQAQMEPPGGPSFGPGVANAQSGMQKSPEEMAVSTCEKILLSVQSEKFAPYAKRAIAILKTGAAMAQQSGPSSGVGQPPKAGESGPQSVAAPPVPGQMPG